ncbi:N-acetyltransferase 9 [Mortierella claussenii]|nr:N-acetyltransferase 9 [Mortierella claussenii]
MTASEPLTLQEEYEMQESWRVDENKMVGDVNLFFNDHDDAYSAEIEIMIAEPSYRRKGMGLEALRMMITYAYKSLGTKRITAKISTENKGSIQLFLTQLGFQQISYSEIFGEVTLERFLGVPAHVHASKEDAGHEQHRVACETNTAAPGEEGHDDVTQALFETLELNEEDIDRQHV